MRRELVLTIAAVVVVVASLTTLALSGAVSDPGDTETDASVDRSGDASLLEVTIAAGDVGGETASLEVDTHLEHRGDAVENVTVVHRATNTDTNLVEHTVESDVGTLDDESEIVVSEAVDVPRDGTHELETFIYVDGVRTESMTHTIAGVDTLTPAYADTTLEFHRFGGDHGGALADVPAIEYSVESTTDDEIALEVSSFLTNTGDETTGDLELEVKARQADSNIVADSATVELDAVEPGETVTPTADLEVAQEYAYYLDAILWLDGTIVATDRAGADLRPDATNESTDGNGLDTSDFDESEDGFETEETSSNGVAEDRDPDDADASATEDDATPGFTLVAGAVALLATIALIRRQTHD
ncbi:MULTISPECIES: DUF7490 domain-containing protein [Natrialbaceae]|uniref:DUF7490 domain-containing protein n=1 Tax=Natrialbaceae TaxID=1644061 RepID=UPI00207D5785|nr:PGF-CTERM sorting domain-containing protein [Natronococcus sp. CG52]